MEIDRFSDVLNLAVGDGEQAKDIVPVGAAVAQLGRTRPVSFRLRNAELLHAGATFTIFGGV
jgi:hypothetical protein